MLKKNKKSLLLAGGLLSALITSSAAGIALSSCGTTTSTTRPTDTETEYTNSINWNDSNTFSSLTKDDQGVYYSDDTKTTVIALDPNLKPTTITLPSTVTTISGYLKVTSSDSTGVQTGAFEGSTSIVTIQVASGSKLTTIDKQAFKGCTSLTGLSNTSGVTKIGSSAFEGCTALKPINLTKVQVIGASAFKNCTAFDGAVDLSNVDSIGASTFYATNITTVNASKNSWLTSIGASAFESCAKLTAVTLPSERISNLTTIGASAFSGCTTLTTVAPSGQSGFYATSKVTTIGSTAFKDTIIESIDFSATSITNSNYELSQTFNNMSMVSSVKLSNTLKNIGYPMFHYCGDKGTGFHLDLPSSIVNFRVTAWGTAPFENSGLKSIDMSKITSYDVTSGYANIINDFQFKGATKLETVILKPGTTSISSGTFQNCTSLKVVKEASQTDVTSGYVATSSITSIGENAFNNAFVKNSGTTIDLSAASLKTVPDAFSGCNATSVKLPSTAAIVAANSFFGSTVGSLTFGASGVSSNGALFTGSKITANTDKTKNPATYAAANVPFGNNASLTTLNYDNFTSSGTTNVSSAQTLFETTSTDTWDQVATIVNSFSNYSYTQGDGSSDSGAIFPANLSTWTAETTTTRKSKVVPDTSIEKKTGSNGKLSSIVFSNCFDVTKDTIGIITIDAAKNTNTFIHNGVTWTYNNDGSKITLTGEVNMYKATSGSTSYLTFFNTQTQSSGSSTYIIPSQTKINVTLTIAAKTAA